MRRRFAIAVGVLLAATAIGFFSFWRHEPSFQGRTLSAWLETLDDGEGDLGMLWLLKPTLTPTPQQVEATAAIRQMGTNAVPKLLAMLQSKEPVLRSIKEGTRHWLTRRGLIEPSYFNELQSPASKTRHRAALGLIALDSSIKPSLAQLLPLFNESQFCKETALVLASMGPEGLAPLQAVVKPNELSWQSCCSIWALAHFPANGRAIGSVLVVGITNNDLSIRHSCAWALTRIQLDPEIAVPALMRALGEDDLRALSLKALSNYGTRARSAVPALLEILHDPHRPHSHDVADALRSIDPDAALNAGMH